MFGRTDVAGRLRPREPGPNGRWFPPEWRLGADAFYGVELPAVEQETARDERRPSSSSDSPTTARIRSRCMTLGPLSNVADAAALDPAFASHLAGIHAMAGTIDAPGTSRTATRRPRTASSGTSAPTRTRWRAVLALDVPITLVGLDATNDVPVPADIVDQLSADHAAAGADIAYEMYARTPFLADGGNSYWDPLAAVTLTDPSVAGWEDVDASRCSPPVPARATSSRDPGGRPVRVAMSADPDAFMAAFLGALRTGARRAHPFALAGSMDVRWDGETCRSSATRRRRPAWSRSCC